MKILLASTAIVILAMNSHAATENFDAVKAGALPEGWIAGVTGRSDPRWAVGTDSTAPSGSNVLQQTGSGTFPWCVKKDLSIADGFVEVKFKPIRGKED